jgi:hypothetical protein
LREEFEDGEDAYRLAKGKVHYSVPSFAPETTSTFFHEECWKKVALKRRKGAAKQPRPERAIDPSTNANSPQQ